MVIQSGYDKEKIREIAKACGSKAVKQSVSFLERMNYLQPEKMVVEIIDGVAFYGAVICKNHLRLYEIAVKSEYQKRGYGRLMIQRLKKVCRENGLERITFRTSKAEDAVKFYRRIGADIIAEKFDDWEMELKV